VTSVTNNIYFLGSIKYTLVLHQHHRSHGNYKVSNLEGQKHDKHDAE